MTDPLTITVPDIGDFGDVPVIEVLVSPGDRVEAETPLVTLESDKATMDVPSPQSGTVESVLVAVGDSVSEGSPLVILAPDAASSPRSAREAETGGRTETVAKTTRADRRHRVPVRLRCDRRRAPPTSKRRSWSSGRVRAVHRRVPRRRLGLRTVLVERYPTLGGVCLNVGCIPSKAVLHTASIIDAAQAMGAHGVKFAAPTIDLPMLAGWKNEVVGRLTTGLAGLAKRRKVRVVHGVGAFSSPHRMCVTTSGGTTEIAFERAIIAAGSQAVEIPEFPNDDPRLMDSTDALVLDDVPARLLVIGGGIIGLEMATVYAALGSRVNVVELMDGAHSRLRPRSRQALEQRIRTIYESIRLSTRVTAIAPDGSGLRVSVRSRGRTRECAGRGDVRPGPRRRGSASERRPIGAGNAGVHVDERGFIPVDRQQRTNVDTSSRSATSSASRCSPTRRLTRARWRPRCAPGRSRASMRLPFRRWLTPTRRSHGRASPRRSPENGESRSKRRPSPGPRAAGRSASAGAKA